MSIQKKNRELTRLGNEEGKVNKNHLFLVKNLEKAERLQYWVPVPGTVIAGFLSGDHDYRYIGNVKDPIIGPLLEKLDELQSCIVGVLEPEKAPNVDIDALIDEIRQQARLLADDPVKQKELKKK